MNATNAKAALASLGGDFYRRGWMYGTSGNLSCRVDDDALPDCMAITASGVDKGHLSSDDILVFSPANGVPEGNLRPSAETSIHEAVYQARPNSRAVLHVHTVESTVYSMTAPSSMQGKTATLEVTGYEMIKGLGVWDEGARVQIPVFENHGQVPLIAEEIGAYLHAHPDCVPVFLIRGHGLTAWGSSLKEARHRLEIGHFLAACEIAQTPASLRS